MAAKSSPDQYDQIRNKLSDLLHWTKNLLTRFSSLIRKDVASDIKVNLQFSNLDESHETNLLASQVKSGKQTKSENLIQSSQKLLVDSADIESVIIIPSLDFPQTELNKILAPNSYEERMLCCLFDLINPNLRIIFISSTPIAKTIVDYYLGLLEKASGISPSEAKKRIKLLSCDDPSISPLSLKVIKKPQLIEMIKNSINPAKALLCSYMGTNLEKALAKEFGVFLFANDPCLSYWGTKAGSRQIFEETGVPHSCGSSLIFSLEVLVNEIERIYKDKNYSVQNFVIKQNVGYAGRGNSKLETKYFDSNHLKKSIKNALENHLEFACLGETYDLWLSKINKIGVIVEIWMDNTESSPSCQGIIHSDGEVEILSTHEQILNGMIYVGCQFPAKDEYRKQIMDYSLKIGHLLSLKGCRERYGVDFVAKTAGEDLIIYAVEINIRWTGTSNTLITTKYLTRGIMGDDGLLVGGDGHKKFYIASDNIRNEVYKCLTTSCFMSLIKKHDELLFNRESLTGVVFYLFSTLSEYGKFGLIAIDNSREKAIDSYKKTLLILERDSSIIDSKQTHIELDIKTKLN